MVIFGAGGDLTKRLLVPALYNLATTGLLPEHFELVGVDMADLDADKWRDSLHTMMQSFVGKAATLCLMYAFPLLFLGAHGGTASEVVRIIGWAFAVWGVALYWWAALLYLAEIRDLVKGVQPS